MEKLHIKKKLNDLTDISVLNDETSADNLNASAKTALLSLVFLCGASCSTNQPWPPRKLFFEGWPPRKLKATTSATEFFLEKKVEKTCDANAALQSPARAGRRFKVRPATT